MRRSDADEPRVPPMTDPSWERSARGVQLRDALRTAPMTPEEVVAWGKRRGMAQDMTRNLLAWGDGRIWWHDGARWRVQR